MEQGADETRRGIEAIPKADLHTVPVNYCFGTSGGNGGIGSFLGVTSGGDAGIGCCGGVGAISGGR